MIVCGKKNKKCSLCENGFCKGNYKQRCKYRIYFETSNKNNSCLEHIKKECAYLAPKEIQELIKYCRRIIKYENP